MTRDILIACLNAAGAICFTAGALLALYAKFTGKG